MLNAAIIGTSLVAAAIMFWPRLRDHSTWRAMITPLASIIGSGFLVLGPVLDHAYGRYAPLAMAGLCLLAYGYGAALRTNISWIGRGNDTPEPAWAERASSALLGFAYTISVAYYLNLFGSFGLSLTPFDSHFNARLLTSAIYVLIAVVGWTKGFKMLETMEYASVSLKLAIISGLLFGLLYYALHKWSSGGVPPNPPTLSGWAALTTGFGLIVTVQGFETSRYLGATYTPQTRIQSMRVAQWVATAIYLIYILLFSAAFNIDDQALSETAIVDMMAVVSVILPALLVAAALAAQFSAAVADTGGCGGLIAEVSGQRINPRQAYVIVVVVGLALTWTSNVFEIISYASRAFAIYYGAQAGLAAWRYRADRRGLALLYVILAVIGLLIALLGQPVE